MAVGCAGMAQAPDTSSGQNTLFVGYDSTLSAGTLVHIGTSDGQEILTFALRKQYQ